MGAKATLRGKFNTYGSRMRFDDGRAVPNGKISCRLRTAGGNPGGFCCDDIAGSVAAPPIYGGDKR